MARMAHTGIPPPAAVAVHALPMATTMEHSITLREMRLAHKKVHLPVPPSIIETDAELALVFYTKVAKIDTEGHNIPFSHSPVSPDQDSRPPRNYGINNKRGYADRQGSAMGSLQLDSPQLER